MFFWLSHSFFVVLKYFFAPLLVIIFFQVIIQSHDSTRNTNNYIFQLICSTTSSFFYNRIEIWSFQLPNVQGKGLPLLVVPLGTTSRNFPKTVIIFFSKNQFFTLYIFLLLAHFWNLSCLPNFCFCNSSLVDVKAFQQLFLLLKELDLVMLDLFCWITQISRNSKSNCWHHRHLQSFALRAFYFLQYACQVCVMHFNFLQTS